MISTGFVGKYAKTAGFGIGKYIRFYVNPEKYINLLRPKDLGKTLLSSLGVLGVGTAGVNLLSSKNKTPEPYKDYNKSLPNHTGMVSTPDYALRISIPTTKQDLSQYYYYNYDR